MLREMLTEELVGNKEVWILGDFNVNTCTTNSTKYWYMSTFLQKTHMKYLMTGATHYHDHGASTLDHIYTNSPHVNTQGLINDRVSDHVPVYAMKKQDKTRHKWKTVQGRFGKSG